MVRVTDAETPRRIRVVGNSGSGKTTYARALARRLGLPHLELDDVFFSTDWQWADLAVAHGRLAAFLAGPGADGWVIDGNWQTRLAGRLDDADTIVWLDYSRARVMGRVLRRTVGRGLTRRELWHGNRERLSNLVRRDPEDNIVLWAWTQHRSYHDKYARLARDDARVVRLASPHEARAWLEHPRRPHVSDA